VSAFPFQSHLGRPAAFVRRRLMRRRPNTSRMGGAERQAVRDFTAFVEAEVTKGKSLAECQPRHYGNIRTRGVLALGAGIISLDRTDRRSARPVGQSTLPRRRCRNLSVRTCRRINERSAYC
jgi:hypothetical protein